MLKPNNWLDQWQSGKLGTGSHVQSFLRAFPSSTDVPVRLLNQPYRSWQRRSFAKSNDRGKVGLHFVPKCNHAHESHTSQYIVYIDIYICILVCWDLEIFLSWQSSKNEFSLLLGLFTSQSCTEAKKVNQKLLSTLLYMYTEYFYSKTGVYYS